MSDKTEFIPPAGGGGDPGSRAPANASASGPLSRGNPASGAPFAIAVLRPRVGSGVPVAIGALAWGIGNALGLTVIAKASFSVGADGALRPTAPGPLLRNDRTSASGEVLFPGDFAPRKPKVDVVVAGRAVGQGPLVGVRLALATSAGIVLDLSRRVAPGAPAGFSAIPNASQPERIKTVGHGPPMMALKANFVLEQFQAAPADQWIAELDPAATLRVEGLHPSRPVIEARLPGARALGLVFGAAKTEEEPTELAFRADTLIFDVERLCVTIVWRATVRLGSLERIARVRGGAGVVLPGEELALPRTADELVFAPAPDEDPSGTLALDAGAVAAGIAAHLAPGAPQKPAAPTPHASTLFSRSDAAPAAPLPFAPAAPGSKPPAVGGDQAGAASAKSWADKLGGKGKTLAVLDGSEPAPAAATPFGGSRPPTQPRGGALTDRLRAWSAAVENPDQTAPPGTKPPTTLPFQKGGKSEPPPAAQPAASELAAPKKGDTIGLLGPSNLPILPFAGEKEKRAALRRDAAVREAEEGAKERAAAEKAAAERLAEQQRVAEARRDEERKRFEEEQARAREIEQRRKAAAQQQAKERAADLENALYGVFSPKKKK